MSGPYASSRSPPPLVHPRPSHISHPPPEPTTSPPPVHNGSGSTGTASATYSPQSVASSFGGNLTNRKSNDTPRKSGEGYMRFSSPPVNIQQQQQQHQQPLNQVGYDASGASFSASQATSMGSGFYAGAGNPAGGYGGYGNSLNGGGLPGAAAPSGSGNAYGGPFGFGAGQAGTGMGFMNDPTAALGMQFGQRAVMAGQEYVEKNFSRYLPLPLLKTSFTVTNSYVFNKLRIILFPWRHKPWSRQIVRRNPMTGGPDMQPGATGPSGTTDAWMAPRDDINAPDLYIPTMALVTYTLLSALASGLQSRFHPEVLGVSLSKAMGVVITEFLAIKLGCYLLDVRSSGASGVELIGYGGYKFVGIIVTILASFLNLGRTFTFAVFSYVFCAQAFFLLRSLKYVLLPDSSISASVNTITHGQRRKRIQFLFVLAVVQVAFMGFLARV